MSITEKKTKYRIIIGDGKEKAECEDIWETRRYEAEIQAIERLYERSKQEVKCRPWVKLVAVGEDFLVRYSSGMRRHDKKKERLEDAYNRLRRDRFLEEMRSAIK
ncbi:hypothetical protein H7T43_09225 [Peribacillus simplex]|uniref:hypothetical protein n=1 Tax=Peribacillus simplex TaxID=1478 RepID=UPI002989C594|nr:hypothetical protein [Peribacillus simplex]MBX9955096.1 hypothetical protein [Peribacillus simplex]